MTDITADKYGNVYISDYSKEEILLVTPQDDSTKVVSLYSKALCPGLDGIVNIEVDDDIIYWT